MYTHRNTLIFIALVNTLILIEATRFVVTRVSVLFLQKSETPVVVANGKISPPKVPAAPEPISIETVTLTPRKTVLPPLPVNKIEVKTPPQIPVPVITEKKPTPVSAPKQAAPVHLLLDNFNGQPKKNSLGGFKGTFGGIGGFCLESLQKGKVSSVYDEEGNILKLVYNVNNGYAGYYSKLNGMDLTSYRRLSFMVKGTVGGEVFEVELGDGLNASKIDIREYLPYGTSTGWQKVTIPLKAFSEVKNWKQMKGNFAIVFEQYLGSPASSTLYLDNIQFE